MKIQFKSACGSVLFITLVTTGVICLYLGSYLMLVRNENQMTRRSQTWNAAIPVAEAGIEEALTRITWSTNIVTDGNGWTLVKNNYYIKTNYVNPSNTNEFYVVGIFPAVGTNGPVIVSEGFTRPPFQANFVSRTIRVNTSTKTLVAKGGIIADKTVDLNGNKIALDSFDSTDPNFSTNFRYDPNKRKDNALLGSNSTIIDTFSTGNADVWGKIATGPGTIMPKIGSNGSVGDKAWHAGGNKGLQTNSWTDDMNVSITPVSLPFASPNAFVKSDKNYDYILTAGGTTTVLDYRIENPSKFTGKVLVTGIGKVRLLVTTDTFSFSGSDTIQIDAGATLELYVASPSVSIGTDIVVASGKAADITYYGLTNNSSLTLKGNGSFTGSIYAPQTDFYLGGGGSSSIQDFTGASVTKTVTMKGRFNFHYDESLPLNLPPAGYIATSWDEINVSWNTIRANNLTSSQLY